MTRITYTLRFRIALKLSTWVLNLLNIRLLTKRADKGLIDELRAGYNNLPVFTGIEPEDTDKSNPLDTWKGNLNLLRENVLNSDIRSFLKWPVLRKTMVIGSEANYVFYELSQLKKHKEWGFYKKALKEIWFGERNMYPFFLHSSAILIHQMYQVAQFESNTAIKTKSHDCILEFGGGYGSMCRLLRNLNFNGQYLIYDLAPFSLLQGPISLISAGIGTLSLLLFSFSLVRYPLDIYLFFLSK